MESRVVWSLTLASPRFFRYTPRDACTDVLQSEHEVHAKKVREVRYRYVPMSKSEIEDVVKVAPKILRFPNWRQRTSLKNFTLLMKERPEFSNPQFTPGLLVDAKVLSKLKTLPKGENMDKLLAILSRGECSRSQLHFK